MAIIYKIEFEWDKKGNSPYVSFWDGENNDQQCKALSAAHGGDFSLIKALPPIIQYTLLNNKGKPRKTNRQCDFPLPVGSGFLMSSKAAECLALFLIENAYLHPVIHKETGDHYMRAFATQFIKGLIDLEKSEYQTLPSGSIWQIKRVVLNEGVSFPDIFKFAESPRGDTYFSQAFVDRYSECGLTGVEFVEVTKRTGL